MYLLLRLFGLGVALMIVVGVPLLIVASIAAVIVTLLPYLLAGAAIAGIVWLVRRAKTIGNWCEQCNDFHQDGLHIATRARENFAERQDRWISWRS